MNTIERYSVPCYKEKDGTLVFCLDPESKRKATEIFSCTYAIYRKIIETTLEKKEKLKTRKFHFIFDSPDSP